MDKWLEFWSHGKTDITIGKTKGILSNYILPTIGVTPLREVTRIQLVQCIHDIIATNKLETANRACSIITRIFDHALNMGLIEYTVAHKLSAIVPAYKHTHRPAIIDSKDLKVLLTSLFSEQGYTHSVKYALRILPYVFVRNSELRCARWDEFNLDNGEWHIPSERMKMREAHYVPLARQVVEVLNELKALQLHDVLLFPSTANRSRPISDNAMRVALLRLGYEKEEISVHGFRTTASTLLHEMGFNSQIIEKQLAHKDTNAIRDAYNRAEFKDERRRMMQKWADYLDNLRG